MTSDEHKELQKALDIIDEILDNIDEFDELNAIYHKLYDFVDEYSEN